MKDVCVCGLRARRCVRLWFTAGTNRPFKFCHYGWCHILNIWLFDKQRLFQSVKVTFCALNILLAKTKVYSIHTTESSPSSISGRRLAGFQEPGLNDKKRKICHYQNRLSMWKQRWLNSQWRGRRSAGFSPRHSCWPRDSGGPSYGCSAYRYCRRRRKHTTSITSWLDWLTYHLLTVSKQSAQLLRWYR